MDTNDAISYVLRIGVVASLFFIILGLVLLFADNGSNGFTLSQLASTNTQIDTSEFIVSGIINGLLRFEGLDFVLLGLIILIATPVIRVMLSVFAFLYERNWLYVIITLIVFIDLMAAIFVVPGLIIH